MIIRTIFLLILLVIVVVCAFYMMYGFYRKVKRENHIDSLAERKERILLSEEREKLDIAKKQVYSKKK